jgi:hypothetical protein
MERSGHSESEEPTSSVSASRAGCVGAPADLGNFTPTGWKKEEKLWVMVGTCTNWNLIREPLGTS